MQWFVSETPIHYSLSMVELQISTSVLLITEDVSMSTSIEKEISFGKYRKRKTKGVTEVLLTDKYWEGNIISHVGSTENGKQRV